MASIKEIFAEAIELPPQQREAFLLQRCAQDVQLRSAVEELVAAHDRAGGFLAEPTVGSPSPLFDLSAPAAVPQH